jgi:hypothetical protein
VTHCPKPGEADKGYLCLYNSIESAVDPGYGVGAPAPAPETCGWLDEPMSTPHVESENSSWTATKVVAVVVAILTVGYMLPWAIACVRDVPHWSVFWVNLLLGWTLVGWIVALVMSLRKQRLVVTG